MKKTWLDNLKSVVSERLGACRTIKADLPGLVNAKWLAFQENGKSDRGFIKEDALIEVLELLDFNSCNFDLTLDEYDELCW